jgi:hypothetical protein
MSATSLRRGADGAPARSTSQSHPAGKTKAVWIRCGPLTDGAPRLRKVSGPDRAPKPAPLQRVDGGIEPQWRRAARRGGSIPCRATGPAEGAPCARKRLGRRALPRRPLGCRNALVADSREPRPGPAPVVHVMLRTGVGPAPTSWSMVDRGREGVHPRCHAAPSQGPTAATWVRSAAASPAGASVTLRNACWRVLGSL